MAVTSLVILYIQVASAKEEENKVQAQAHLYYQTLRGKNSGPH